MNRNSHNLRGSSVNPASRWRTVFIALVLVLAIESAGQAPPVLAAPAAMELRYSMLARKLRGNNATICVGDDVPIHVRVTRAEFVGAQGYHVQDIPGVRVEASVSNGGIGKLNPISIHTGWSSDDPGGADYKFHAEKVGTTIISFKGTINQVWWGAKLGLAPFVTRRDFVEDQVEITVEECQYKVTVSSSFPVPDMFIGAVFKDALMTLDAQGFYSGTATVTWSGYWLPFGGARISCVNFLKTLAPSKATLVGLVNESGQLELTIAYDPHNLAWSQKCTGLERSEYKFEATATDLKFNVPASGEAGKLEYQAVDSVPECCGLSGQATITIVAEKAGSGQ